MVDYYENVQLLRKVQHEKTLVDEKVQAKIRAAKLEDAESLAEISVLADMGDGETGFFIGSCTKEQYEHRIANYEVLVIEINNRVAAYISIQNELPQHIKDALPIGYHSYKHIMGLGVHPDFKKMGCARALKHYANKYNCISEVFLYPRCNIASVKMNLAVGYKFISAISSCMQDDNKLYEAAVFTNRLI